MRRLLLAALGVLLLWVASRLGPVPEGAPPESSAALRPEPIHELLGPFRPLWAHLVLLRLERNTLRGDLFECLEDVKTVLRLMPRSVSLWESLTYWLVLDLPAAEADRERARHWVREGLRLIESGRAMLPDSAELCRVAGDCWQLLAQEHPERLAAELSPAQAIERALAAYQEGIHRAAPGTHERERLLFQQSLLVESLLRGSTPEDLTARAREIAQDLLQLADLSTDCRIHLEGVMAPRIP